MWSDVAVCAVIVTYNRKEYLRKLIDALKIQTHPLAGLFIFDNMSTDGTPEMLTENGLIDRAEIGECIRSDAWLAPLYYYRNHTNSGGSGGFHNAMKMASQMGFDFLWIMDDDVLPERDCLERLLQYTDENARICVPNRTDENWQDSAVTAIDMKDPFKYSITAMKTRCTATQIQGEYLPVCDMPFEGPLIAVSVIREIGLPKEDLFILFDDTEFAQRAVKVTEIRFVKKAILHRQIIQINEKKHLMNWKDYYSYRNLFWFNKTYGKNVYVRVLRPFVQMLRSTVKSVILGRWANATVVTAAYRDAMNGKMGKTVEPGQMPK